MDVLKICASSWSLAKVMVCNTGGMIVTSRNVGKVEFLADTYTMMMSGGVGHSTHWSSQPVQSQ